MPLVEELMPFIGTREQMLNCHRTYLLTDFHSFQTEFAIIIIGSWCQKDIASRDIDMHCDVSTVGDSSWNGFTLLYSCVRSSNHALFTGLQNADCLLCRRRTSQELRWLLTVETECFHKAVRDLFASYTRLTNDLKRHCMSILLWYHYKIYSHTLLHLQQVNSCNFLLEFVHQWDSFGTDNNFH